MEYGPRVIVEGENLAVLPTLSDDAFDLVYADPPFNPGRRRFRVAGAGPSFADAYPDYPSFLRPRLEEMRRVLAPHGTLYLHLAFREAHRVKLLLDEIFGPDAFLNELVWAYDYGGKPR